MEPEEKTVLFFLTLKKHLESRLHFFCEMYTLKRESEISFENVKNDTVLTDDLKDIYSSYALLNNLSIIKNEIHKTKDLLENIDEKLYSTCKHDFVEDLIDLSFEKSKKIKYCKKCCMDYK